MLVISEKTLFACLGLSQDGDLKAAHRSPPSYKINLPSRAHTHARLGSVAVVAKNELRQNQRARKPGAAPMKSGRLQAPMA